jgi:hypothetical protein
MIYTKALREVWYDLYINKLSGESNYSIACESAKTVIAVTLLEEGFIPDNEWYLETFNSPVVNMLENPVECMALLKFAKLQETRSLIQHKHKLTKVYDELFLPFEYDTKVDDPSKHISEADLLLDDLHRYRTNNRSSLHAFSDSTGISKYTLNSLITDYSQFSTEELTLNRRLFITKSRHPVYKNDMPDETWEAIPYLVYINTSAQ